MERSAADSRRDGTDDRQRYEIWHNSELAEYFLACVEVGAAQGSEPDVGAGTSMSSVKVAPRLCVGFVKASPRYLVIETGLFTRNRAAVREQRALFSSVAARQSFNHDTPSGPLSAARRFARLMW